MIENERLKTTLTVLNQKLIVQVDNQKILDALKLENYEKEQAVFELKSENAHLKSQVEQKDNKISDLIEKLEESERSREEFKKDCDNMNDDIVQIEEKLFESKTMQLELLDTTKELDDQLQESRQKIQ